MKKKLYEKKYKIEYDKKHYTFITFKLKKDEAEDFKNKLKAENVGITEFFKICIKNYKEILKNY